LRTNLKSGILKLEESNFGEVVQDLFNETILCPFSLCNIAKVMEE
jgi:hypothetical protein